MAAPLTYLEATELEGIQPLTFRDFLEGVVAGAAIAALLMGC